MDEANFMTVKMVYFFSLMLERGSWSWRQSGQHKFLCSRFRMAKEYFCFIRLLFFPLLHNWFPLLATAVGSHTTSFKKRKKKLFWHQKFSKCFPREATFLPTRTVWPKNEFILNWTAILLSTFEWMCWIKVKPNHVFKILKRMHYIMIIIT